MYNPDRKSNRRYVMLKKILALFLVSGMIALGASAGLAAGEETAKQTIVKMGENIEIPRDAEVETAVAIGGSITVHGKVVKDVVAVGGSVYLEDWALVGGDAVSIGGSIERSPQAIVKGDIVEVAVPGIAPMMGAFARGGMFKGWAIFSILSFLGFLALVLILVALFRPQLERVSAAVGRNLLKTFLVGLLVVFLFVPVIILLVISIAGIILVPVWVIVVGVGGLFGYIAAAHFIGEKILKAFKLTVKTAMVKALAGVIVLSLVGLVPIAGFVVKAVISTMGLGAVALTRFGTEKA
jgi:hypothetical protein